MATDVGTLIVTMGLESDGYRRGLSDAKAQNRDFAQSADTMSSRVRRSLANLGGGTTGYQRDLRGAGAETRRFEQISTGMTNRVKAGLVALGGAFTISIVTDAVRQGLDYASALGEQAQQLGVTTRSLQEYRYAATQVGLSTEEMDSALARLTRTIGTSPEKLERLGIATRDANGHFRDAGDILPDLAEKLRGMDAAERAAVLVDLFGRSGQKLAPLLADGAAGVNNLRDAAQRLGLVLSDEQIQKADETADKLSALRTVLEAQIAGSVSDNTDSILALVQALTDLVAWSGRAVTAWRGFSQTVERRIANTLTYSPFESDRADGRRRIRQLNQEQFGGQPVELTMTNEQAAARRARIPAPVGNLPSNPYLSSPALSRLGPQRNTRNFIDDLSDQVLNGAPQIEARVERMLTTMATSAQRAGPEVAVPIVNALQTVLNQTTRISDAAQPLIDRLFPEAARLRTYQEELALLRTEFDAGRLSIDLHAEAVNRLNREYRGIPSTAEFARDAVASLNLFGDDGKAAIDAQTERELQRNTEALMRSWGIAADGLEATNVRIVESFAEMTQGALDSIDKLTRGIKSGNILDIVSGILGALDKIGAIAGGFNVGPFAFGGARAEGGPVSGGRTYLVGERGPELFTPSRSGAIIANDNLRGGSSAIRVTIDAGPGIHAIARDESGRMIAQTGPTIAAGGSLLAQQDLARRNAYAIPA